MCQQPLQGRSLAPVAAFDGLGNTHLQPPHQLLDSFPVDLLPVLGVGERRISSGRNCHLLFFLRDGSAHSLARRDQTDVGVSGALRIGVSFFGPLNAAALDPPCGEVCPVRTRASTTAFPCSTTIHNECFRSALYTGSAMFAFGQTDTART